MAASWRPVMDLLARGCTWSRTTGPGRAGLGASPPATDPVILARQVADLRSVIAAATAGRCVLAGHSWGGILVQMLAVQQPHLVAGVIQQVAAEAAGGAG